MIIPGAPWQLGREEALPSVDFGGSFSVGRFQRGNQGGWPWFVPFRQGGTRTCCLELG